LVVKYIIEMSKLRNLP